MEGESIFLKEHARKLLKNKRIVLVGDSNMRALYKDLVGLIEEGTLGHDAWFKIPLPKSYKGDRITYTTGLTKNRNYREERRYTEHGVDIRYAFATRLWRPNPFLEEYLDKVKRREERRPHLVAVMCMPWDLTRWGPNGGDKMLERLRDVVSVVKETLRPSTFLWITYPPLSSDAKRGFVTQWTSCLNDAMPIAVVEANVRCARYLQSVQIDVLDLHYEMRHLVDNRDKDGIHWSPGGIRLMLNCLLKHVCLMWKIKPPGLPKGVVFSELREDLIRKIDKHPSNQVSGVNVEMIVGSNGSWRNVRKLPGREVNFSSDLLVKNVY